MDLDMNSAQATIKSYEIAHANPEKREVSIKNMVMIVGTHKMLIPECTLIINGGVDVPKRRPQKGQRNSKTKE